MSNNDQAVDVVMALSSGGAKTFDDLRLEIGASRTDLAVALRDLDCDGWIMVLGFPVTSAYALTMTGRNLISAARRTRPRITARAA
jgi:DNA-binding HxlR family transcriptional regulator